MKENTANNTKKISALDINKVKMKKFNDPKFTALFEDVAEVRAAAEKAIGSKGVSYCLTNKEKQCICLYTFDKSLDPENSKRFRLTLNYTFVAKGCEKQEAEFVEYLKAEIQEMIVFTGVNSVDWNGEITTEKDIENSSYAPYGMSAASFFSLGVVFLLCFDSMDYLGYLFIFLGFASICSGAAIKIGKDKVKISKGKILIGDDSADEDKN
ncbi:hypothetical protein [uncultured Ruminococcus sp.]|uniref:hypothetical protein n=1 Tax=uncultured Ruminococcus sp. TaxID=165186 RepID=UPI0025E6522E|nr:hypothetical protein [uncultured Ruminococcus sp.]